MSAPALPDDCVITRSVADVSKSFIQVNIQKAAGPDGLPGRVLRACADQLSIFNLSLSKSVIPTCLKQTTIVPVPKNTWVQGGGEGTRSVVSGKQPLTQRQQNKMMIVDFRKQHRWNSSGEGG